MTRFMAQRILTGEWLDEDLPIADPEITDTLSGPIGISGSLDPERTRLIGDDGDPILEEWATWLHVEDAGEIRASGIVVFSQFRGPQWRIEAAGPSTYPHGMPYLNVLRGTALDPLDVVRDIWAHLQGQPDGDLGTVVDDTTSPVRIGEQLHYTADFRPDDKENPERWEALSREVRSDPPSGNLDVLRRFAGLAQRQLDDGGTFFEDFTWPGMHPFAERFHNFAADLFYRRGNTFTTGNVEGFLGIIPNIVHVVEAQPYELVWWETPDCGQEIDNLSRETPFDYRDEASWNADRTSVEHRIRLGYPRLGRRQHHLRFATGENITAIVEPERDGDEYANEIVGIGKGEGSKTLRTRVPQRDGRLRRSHVLEDKTVESRARLRELSRDELHARRQLIEIPEIEIDAKHPNAPVGSFGPGDDILVQAEVGWLGDVSVWHRITSSTYMPDSGLVRLALARSDRYRYGAPNG